MAAHPRWQWARPWRASAQWLANAPIDDPVDRRNAPMLQIVLLMLGGLPPLMWLYRLLATDLPWRAGETGSLVMSVVLSVLALLSLALIRRGRFQWAIRQLLVVAALLTLLSYLDSGMDANRFEQPIQMIWLVMAGLLVGRRALWLMYAALVVAFAAGTRVDIGTLAQAALERSVDGTISALIFLFIAIVVDRSVAALREGLAIANTRGAELADANARLQAQMFEQQRLKEQLIHAQKVEAVGRLAAGVAHDFNHLLTLILGFAARAAREDDPGKLKSALAGVDSAARRAVAVTHRLLNFSRHDATRAEVFDVGQDLKDMQPTLRQLFDPGITVSLALDDTALPVCIDRAQWELVVLNIASNANDAMGHDGQFDVAARELADGNGVDLTFRDSGHGMTAAAQQRLFEPFFTTKPPGKGSGIGLAVAAAVIGDAGGSLVLERTGPTGSTFRIRLPLPHGASVEAEPLAQSMKD